VEELERLWANLYYGSSAGSQLYLTQATHHKH